MSGFKPYEGPNEIVERLRAELAAMRQQRDEAMDIAATHKRNWYEAKTEYGTALGKVRAELAAAKAQLVSNADELAAMQKQRDEAHGLIRKWKVNLVDVVDQGEYLYAMTSEARCSMNEADKRAFRAATRKEGGGA